jgi:hypothetical protein
MEVRMTRPGRGGAGPDRGLLSFAAVKAATDLAALVAEAGVEVNRAHMARCPFHDDRHPSLQVKGERWRCFGCGAHGDCFDWCVRFYGMGTGEALRYLGARAGIAPVARTAPAAPAAPTAPAGPVAPMAASRGAAPGPRPEAGNEGRRRDLRADFLAWVSREKGQNADRIRRLDRIIDRIVARPDDLATETAKILYDMRVSYEAFEEALWNREWEVLLGYYREWVVYGRSVL